MRYAQLLASLIDRIINVYEQNDRRKSRDRTLILQKMSSISEMTVICGTIAYLLVATFHFINPIYGYFCQHELKALFPLYIPFVDEHTAVGAVSLISIQSIEVFAAALASACADFLFVTAAINIWVFCTIFQQNLFELNDILHEKNADVPLPLATAKLRSIFEMYNDNWK